MYIYAYGGEWVKEAEDETQETFGILTIRWYPSKLIILLTRLTAVGILKAIQEKMFAQVSPFTGNSSQIVNSHILTRNEGRKSLCSSN